MKKMLTMLVPSIAERDPAYLDFFLRSIYCWNADVSDRVQIILFKQRGSDNSPYMAKVRFHKLDISVVDPQHAQVGDLCLWDTLRSWRAAWPIIRGTWLTTCHPECVWLPGRLGKTLDYLEATDRKIVLGNLRRFDYRFDEIGQPFYMPEEGDRITKELMAGSDPELFESTPSIHWPKWLPKNAVTPGEYVAWEEDLFFARTEWLDSWRMPFHCEDMPLQDVYDMMGTAIRETNYGPISRMPLDIHAQLHLSHPKGFSCFREDVRDWFLSDPKWTGTAFADRDLWERLIANRDNPEANHPNLVELRWGPTGTVTRYMNSLRRAIEAGEVKL